MRSLAAEVHREFLRQLTIWVMLSVGLGITVVVVLRTSETDPTREEVPIVIEGARTRLTSGANPFDFPRSAISDLPPPPPTRRPSAKAATVLAPAPALPLEAAVPAAAAGAPGAHAKHAKALPAAGHDADDATSGAAAVPSAGAGRDADLPMPPSEGAAPR
jgi:hypothetical protein